MIQSDSNMVNRLLLSETDFLEILYQYDKAGLRDEAMPLFLEITNPDNWPNTDALYLCWLEAVRMNAQQDYEQGTSFSLPPSMLVLDLGRKEYCPAYDELLSVNEND